MSDGTVVEVLARLKADAGDFIRGTKAAKDSTASLSKQAKETSAALYILGQEAKKAGHDAEVMAAEVAAATVVIRASREEAQRLGGVWRDTAGRLRDAKGHFTTMEKAAAALAHGTESVVAPLGRLERGLVKVIDKAKSLVPSLDNLKSNFGDLASKGKEAAAGVGAKWAAIGAGILAVGPQLISYIQQLSGVIALLPAVAAAGAVAIGTLAIGMSGFLNAVKHSGDPKKFAEALKTLPPPAQAAARALAALAPIFRGFRAMIQSKLFAGMAETFKSIGSFLPQVISGFQAVASALNGIIRGALGFITSAQGVAIWNQVLSGTASLLNGMRQGFVYLLDAIGTLAGTGSSMLGGLGQGFTNVMQRFDTFIHRVSADGSLKAFIQGGIDAMRGLFSVIKSLGMIWGAISSAIRTAQGGLSSGFAGLIRQAAAWMQSAEGQKVLVTIFREVHKAVVAVGQIISAIIDVAKLVAPILLPIVGIVLRIVEAVAKHKNIVKALIIAWLALQGPIALLVLLAAGIKYAYDHCETFRRIVLKLASVIMANIAQCIETFKWFADVVMTALTWIAKGAAKAFGWVPGLGPKLKAAAAAMEGFKQVADDALDSAAAKARQLSIELDLAAAPRTAYINIVTRQVQEGDLPLHTGQKGGNSDKVSDNPYGLGKGVYVPAPSKPKPPPIPQIPPMGGPGFGPTGSTGSKAAPAKALPPTLANIPIVNDTARLAQMTQVLAAVVAAAGQTITKFYVAPLQATQQTVAAASAAASRAQQHFAYTVSVAAQADAKAAAARKKYLAEHAKTVEMLKASNGKMTDAIRLQERAEAAAKKAAEAAATAATKAGAAATAAYNAAAAAAKALADANAALAQVKYDQMREAATKALDAIKTKIAEVQAKIDSLVSAFASGVQQMADLSTVYNNIAGSLQAARDSAASTYTSAMDNLTAANERLAQAQQAVLDTDPTAQARNNVAVLKSAADLARALGVSVDQIANIQDVADPAQAKAQAELAAAQQAVTMAQQAAAQAAQALSTAAAAYNPDNVAKQVADSLADTAGKAQQFLSDLTLLQANGASDALVQQVAAMGPVIGDAFAQSLLKGGKAMIDTMNANIAAIDKVTTTGITNLAKTMYGPMLDATTQALNAMKSQFAQVFGEIADEIAALMAQATGMQTGTRSAVGRVPLTPISRGAGGVSLARRGGSGIGDVTFGDIKVTVPATAGGVTPEHVADAVQKGVTEAMGGLRRILENA